MVPPAEPGGWKRQDAIRRLDEVSESEKRLLEDAGAGTVRGLAECDPSTLSEATGFEPELVEHWIAWAKQIVADEEEGAGSHEPGITGSGSLQGTDTSSTSGTRWRAAATVLFLVAAVLFLLATPDLSFEGQGLDGETRSYEADCDSPLYLEQRVIEEEGLCQWNVELLLAACLVAVPGALMWWGSYREGSDEAP